MPAIFFTNPGTAAAFLTSALPAVVRMGGLYPATFKAAITGYSLAGQSNYQLQNALRDYIYLYVFGERAGDLTVQGVAFAGDCMSNTNRSGVDDVVDFYNANRVSMTGTPVSVSLGNLTTILGFLVAFNFQVADPRDGLGVFSLTFKYPPRRTAPELTTALTEQPESIAPAVLAS